MSKHIPLRNVPGHATVDENASEEVIEALNKVAEIAWAHRNDGCGNCANLVVQNPTLDSPYGEISCAKNVCDLITDDMLKRNPGCPHHQPITKNL